MLPKSLERRLLLSRRSRTQPILLLGLRNTSSINSSKLCGSDTSDAAFLILAQPRLLGIAKQAAGQKVRDEAENDAHKGNGVEKVHRVAKDADANYDAPEIGSKERDIKHGGRAHAQNQRRKGVEEGEAESVANQPADDLRGPVCLLERVAVEDGGLDTVDDHAKEADEGEDVVHGGLGDEPLLEDVAGAVEGGAEEGEKVAFEHVGGVAAAIVGHLVGCNENAHAAAADKDADDLENLVADFEDEEGDENDADNGPEVEELRGEEVCVTVSFDGKVVALDIQRCHDDVLPAILPDCAGVGAWPVPEDEDDGVDEEEQDVVEDGLEGWDVGVVLGEEAGKGIGGSDAQREHLADGDDDPKVGGGEIAPPVG